MKIQFFLKRTRFPILAILTSLFIFEAIHLNADCVRKVEVGPAYVHIDVLQSRKTIEQLDMAAVRADASFVYGKGWCIKPCAIYGKEHQGELFNVSGSIGRCIPIKKIVVITPLVGLSYTNLLATIHVDFGPMGKVKFQERFRSFAPYIGVEAIFPISENMRFCANVQHAWSYSKIRVRDLFRSKSDSEGPNFGLLLEYDLNCDWSVNVGFAYNESLSQEKNGLRGRGAKIGLARWF